MCAGRERLADRSDGYIKSYLLEGSAPCPFVEDVVEAEGKVEGAGTCCSRDNCLGFVFHTVIGADELDCGEYAFKDSDEAFDDGVVG